MKAVLIYFKRNKLVMNHKQNKEQVYTKIVPKKCKYLNEDEYIVQ